MRFIYDTKNMGISQRSYEALKDALSVGSKKVQVGTVLQVNTLDIICGFAVVYCGEDERGEREFICYFTGDGFRTDGGGEGGRYYAQAMEFLRKKGIERVEVVNLKINPRTTAYEYMGSIIYAIESFLLNKETNDERKWHESGNWKGKHFVQLFGETRGTILTKKCTTARF